MFIIAGIFPCLTVGRNVQGALIVCLVFENLAFLLRVETSDVFRFVSRVQPCMRITCFSFFSGASNLRTCTTEVPFYMFYLYA